MFSNFFSFVFYKIFPQHLIALTVVVHVDVARIVADAADDDAFHPDVRVVAAAAVQILMVMKKMCANSHSFMGLLMLAHTFELIVYNVSLALR